MGKTPPPLEVVQLIRPAAIVWIGYLIVLAIINQAAVASAPIPRPGGYQVPIRSDIVYYTVAGFVALLCLGLAYWSWLQQRLGRALIPVIIALITIVPMLAVWAIVRFFPRSPMFDLQSSVLLLLPFLIFAFLLAAWKYKWPYMLLIILGITGLNLII